MNSINLTGMIVRENPTIVLSASGLEYCRFTLSVRRKYVDKYDFIDCVAYRSVANNICKTLKKGDMISVLGELHVDKFEKDNIKRNYISVSIESFSFCTRRKDKTDSDCSVEYEDNKVSEASDSPKKDIKEEIGIDYNFDDDDLPF